MRANFGTITPVAAAFKQIGGIAFGLMLPVLAGFIAMSIGDRPALAVGFVGYTSFSKKKIRNMIADDTNVSVYMNSNYKSKTYLDHEIRYNKVNHMYYIYVRMRKKDFTEKKNVRRNI